jgi:hypothetical protein
MRVDKAHFGTSVLCIKITSVVNDGTIIFHHHPYGCVVCNHRGDVWEGFAAGVPRGVRGDVRAAPVQLTQPVNTRNACEAKRSVLMKGNSL